MMDAYKRFHDLLKRDFFPLLRADEFKGSGTTFRRIHGDRTDVVNVQGSRSGGKCCVNLAVHYSFLPSEGGGRMTDPKKLKEYDCTFRSRLNEGTEDHWWDYGVTDAKAEASVTSLVDLYKRRGTLFFAKFEPFPDVFERVNPRQLDAGDFTGMPMTGTRVYAALTMARIMKYLGRIDMCRILPM
jgi:hypothetical protein